MEFHPVSDLFFEKSAHPTVKRKILARGYTQFLFRVENRSIFLTFRPDKIEGPIRSIASWLKTAVFWSYIQFLLELSVVRQNIFRSSPDPSQREAGKDSPVIAVFEKESMVFTRPALFCTLHP
jgi:hypothetical protein